MNTLTQNLIPQTGFNTLIQSVKNTCMGVGKSLIINNLRDIFMTFGEGCGLLRKSFFYIIYK